MSEEIEDLYFSWEFKNKKGYIGGVDIDTLEKTVAIWVRIVPIHLRYHSISS